MPNIHHINTDTSNPERHNPRYYRSWWQKKFPLFYSNLNDPKHHSESKHFILRHFKRLDKFKRAYPRIAYATQIIIPIVFLACIPVSWAVLPGVLTLSAAALLAIQIIITLASVVLAGLSWISKLLGERAFGANVLPFDTLYHKNAIQGLMTFPQEHIDSAQLAEDSTAITMTRGTATGTLTCKTGHMPRLQIKADNHVDLGYLEGYMQGYQMVTVLQNLKHIPCDAT